MVAEEQQANAPTPEPTDAELAELVARKRQEYEASQSKTSDLERAIPQSSKPETRQGECASCGREVAERFVKLPEGVVPIGRTDGGMWVPDSECECEAENEMAEWEQMRKEARLESLRSASELPRRLSKFTFDRYDATASRCAAEAAREAIEYAGSFERKAEDGAGLAFTGTPGTGKSHLACAILQSVMDRGIPSLFVTVPSLLERIRESYRDENSEEADLLKRAQGAEFLVLDDLGSEKPSEWAQERLFTLVNHRYAAGLPTVVTTNHTPTELSDRIGARTVSRLAEMCEWVRLDGPDWRMEGLV